MRKDNEITAIEKAKKYCCKGCNMFEQGIKKGEAIADNNPLINCAKNVVLQDLSDEGLSKFADNCNEAYADAIAEMHNRAQKKRGQKPKQ